MASSISLIVVISVKYLGLILRADNNGEGGILALAALVSPMRAREGSRSGRVLLLMGLFGAALLYGDGMITPAISAVALASCRDKARDNIGASRHS